MSRVYESLRRVEMENRPTGKSRREPAHAVDLLKQIVAERAELEGARSVKADVPAGSRLVALSDSQSLPSEKFRVLAARLENLRGQRELKSLLITSSVVNEGKTLTAGNLGITLAKHAGVRVLLVEGDLHKPKLASLLGLTRLGGLSDWWPQQEENLTPFIYKLEGMPLWFLGCGQACDQPAHVLQSGRFAEAFTKLSGYFDWIVVDSAPMSPTVDVNLWLRLVDGMLIVVREGVARIKALERGLASLDNPKLIGIVLNEVTETGQGKYTGQYSTGTHGS
jgi:tyrosine-protein kinase